jgi:hypothetical protein
MKIQLSKYLITINAGGDTESMVIKKLVDAIKNDISETLNTYTEELESRLRQNFENSISKHEKCAMDIDVKASVQFSADSIPPQVFIKSEMKMKRSIPAPVD